MHIKYSPCNSKKETVITVKDVTTVVIDGEEYTFDADGVQWPDVAKETKGTILEAHRENGELYLTILRFYSGSCSEWDTGDYHEVTE